jgi:oligopeptide transport system ATP-binding protein
VLDESQREKCMTDDPALEDRGAGHLNACHFAEPVRVL